MTLRCCGIRLSVLELMAVLAVVAPSASALPPDSRLADGLGELEDHLGFELQLADGASGGLAEAAWRLSGRPEIVRRLRALQHLGGLGPPGLRARACAAGALRTILRGAPSRAPDIEWALRRGQRRLDRCAVVSPVAGLPPGRLAYEAGGEQTTNVYTSEQDGRDARLVAVPPLPPGMRPSPVNLVGAPRWSRDGGRLAFVSLSLDGDHPLAARGRLIVADEAGSRSLGEVSPAGGPPSWSPDGRALAVGSSIRGGIVTVPVDGSTRPPPLSAGRLDPVDLADWSPDGALIAVARSPILGAKAIGTIALSGGVTTRIATAGLSPRSTILSIEWSPDGSSLLVEDGLVVYVVPADGSGARLVTSRGTGARWLPDGRILFQALRGGDFVVADADGGGRRPVLREWRRRVEAAGFGRIGTPTVRPS